MLRVDVWESDLLSDDQIFVSRVLLRNARSDLTHTEHACMQMLYASNMAKAHLHGYFATTKKTFLFACLKKESCLGVAIHEVGKILGKRARMSTTCRCMQDGTGKRAC
jgi:hypothetical protein